MDGGSGENLTEISLTLHLKDEEISLDNGEGSLSPSRNSSPTRSDGRLVQTDTVDLTTVERQTCLSHENIYQVKDENVYEGEDGSWSPNKSLKT